MATAKKASSKGASSKKGAAKHAYRKSAPLKEGESLIKVVDGIPATRTGRTTDAEYKIIEKHLDDLKPNKNHIVVPKRLRGALVKTWDSKHPGIKLKFSNPKHTPNHILVWRTL